MIYAIKMKKIIVCGVVFFVQISIVLCKHRGGWDYLVFAQNWPPASCLAAPHGKCLISKGVTEWIIHGLWPTSKHGSPSFCNSSWHFNPELIKPLLAALSVKWPNIFKGSTEDDFWKHEWMKHGTCAASYDKLDNEYKYFKTTLELHDKLDIYQLLRKVGITPDGKEPQLFMAVEKALNLQLNKKIKILCDTYKSYPYPVLTSVYLCVDKNFELIDCDDDKDNSCDKAYVFYLPFANSQFRLPKFIDMYLHGNNDMCDVPTIKLI